MDRRTLLASVAGIGTTALTGCLGGDSDDAFTLSVADTSFGEGPDGSLQVTVVVSNVGGTEQTGTVLLTGDLNGEEITRVRTVTLEPHTTREIRIEFDVAYANVSSFSYDARVKRSKG